jgi:hypothetical protein
LTHVVASVVVLALAGAGAAALCGHVVAEQVMGESRAETDAASTRRTGEWLGREGAGVGTRRREMRASQRTARR